ncbi:hypothetical protein CARUB_v10024867mg [Capsella rubella]|uniref:KIB1-4 beta-propeller domain-containing protein n=1 Tax=Capsella rubella TaxID=81985 RepID=R0HTC5_9BRAS|nr:hypothetical protein CARUB_v10024867mg [Capsella rubella]
MSSVMPDWSQPPEELLQLISQKLELEDYCFDVVHARSVCRLWRTLFPFPSCLLRPSYSLPSFVDFSLENKDLCTLEKVPLFLFRVQAPAALPSEYILGGIRRAESKDRMELPSPLSIMTDWDTEVYAQRYRGAAFLPLNKDGGGGGEFVVWWTWLKNTSNASCSDLVTFRGRFYAAYYNGDIFSFDPYSMQWSSMMPSEPLHSSSYLIPYGDDELYLVVSFNPFPGAKVLNLNRLTCRVSRLDAETGKWVVVSDLGDRVLFIGHFGNVCCSGKELPDGCGVTANSILFTNAGYLTFAYKYGVHTGREDDELNIWRFSREYRVMVLNTSPVVTLRVEGEAENRAIVT